MEYALIAALAAVSGFLHLVVIREVGRQRDHINTLGKACMSMIDEMIREKQIQIDLIEKRVRDCDHKG